MLCNVKLVGCVVMLIIIGSIYTIGEETRNLILFSHHLAANVIMIWIYLLLWRCSLHVSYQTRTQTDKIISFYAVFLC